VVGGLISTMASSKATATNDETDRDLSPGWIVALTVACLIVSGWLVFHIISCATILSLVVAPTPESRQALVALSLFVTGIVFACATISNDNLQDLKTGQLVGASPRRQQIALIVGVAAGASVIPWVLNLLAKAYGFAGAPNVNVIAPNPLPAPQATLISALAQGVIGGNLDWKML